MKILLVNPPIRSTVPPKDYPYGLALIAAMLERHNIRFDVLDVNGHRYDDDTVLKHVAEGHYDIIGIGGLITTYSYIRKFIAQARSASPGTKIVIGGGVATWDPEFILKRVGPDMVVQGEGEDTFPDVVKNFDFKDMNNGRPFKGAAYYDHFGRFIFEKRELIKSLDSLPLPAWDRFPMEIYASNSKYEDTGRLLSRGIGVYTSRGCPMDCSFCYHIFGRGIRFRAMTAVIDEIEELKRRYNPDYIEFEDEYFTVNKERVLKFCSIYKSADIKLPFRVRGRLDVIDDDMILALIDAGCLSYGVGVESGSPRILNNMQKHITLEAMARGINILRRHGLKIAPSFIHGMTGENEATVKESLAFYKRMNFRNVRPFYIQPYPGSPMWTDEVRLNVLAKYKDLERYIESLDEAMDFIINISELSDRRLKQLYRAIVVEMSGLSGLKYFFLELSARLGRVRDKGLIWAVKRLIHKVSKQKR